MIQNNRPRPRAEKIIDVFLSSESMADIILLFRNNPKLIANKETIASRIGKYAKSLESDLKRLVKLGILKAEKTGGQEWFGFDAEKDKKIQKIIENHIRNYEKNEDKLKTDEKGS